MYLDAVLSGYRLVAVPPNQQLRDELVLLSDNELQQKLLQLKPDQHNRTDLEQRERLIRAIEIAVGEQAVTKELPPLPQMSPRIFGIKWRREVLRQRIAVRLLQRFEAGMIEEVQQLHDSGVAWEKLEFYGLEYRLIAQYLQEKLNRNDMGQKLRSAIGQFAKRQETFFRRMEKRGVEICWLDGEGDVFGELCEVMARRWYSGDRYLLRVPRIQFSTATIQVTGYFFARLKKMNPVGGSEPAGSKVSFEQTTNKIP